jgi:hypothetical protein
LDCVATKADCANRPLSAAEQGLPEVFLPVNPSTLRVFKHLQKFDPSGYPSAGVSDPSGRFCDGAHSKSGQGHMPKFCEGYSQAQAE